MLACFRLTKGRGAYFRPETIDASFMHLRVFLFKVLFNHTREHQFVALHYHIIEVMLTIKYVIMGGFYNIDLKLKVNYP